MSTVRRLAGWLFRFLLASMAATGVLGAVATGNYPALVAAVPLILYVVAVAGRNYYRAAKGVA